MTKPKKKKVQPGAVQIKVTATELTIKNHHAKIKTGVDVMTWTITGGNLNVNFDKGGTPFSRSQYTASPGNPASSNIVPRGSGDATYDYTMYILPDAGTAMLTVDPQVEVNDGSVPWGQQGGGGGTGPVAGKKAAKKKAAKKKSAKKSRRRR